MTRRRALASAAIFIAIAFAGCSFFSRSKSRFFSLERIPPAGMTTAAPAAGSTSRALPIGIDTLELPPGFDRREVVVRQANHQLDVRSTDQWSASLQDMVLHTLSFDLAARLPEGSVVFPGEAKPLAMRSIDVAIEEFAAGPDSNVVLDGRWVLHANGRPDITHHERVTIPVPSLDSANIATGMSQALAAFADRVAAGLGT